MLGFSVKTREAEYPDQKPWIPFSERIVFMISATLGSEDGVSERAASMEAVCFRVTILEMGAVKAFEHAPAIVPTTSSSKAGRVVALGPCFCSLFVLM